MSKIFGALGKFSVKFRWFILVIWIVGTFASIHFLPSLSSVVTNDNRAFLPSNAPSLQAAQLASPFLNTNDSQVIVVAEANASKLTQSERSAFVALNKQLEKDPSVISTKIAGESPDQRAIQAVITSRRSPFANTGLDTLVASLRNTIKHDASLSGMSVHLAGQIATTVDANAGNAGGPGKAQNYSVFLIIAILLVVFRALLAPIITLLPPLFVVLAGGPIVAEASKAGFTVSFVTQLLYIILIIGAGTDYGLFLVFRVREELRRGHDPKGAVALALAKVGESITFSGATVIAALLSLVTAQFGFYRGLGWPLAIGVTLMLLAGLTLLPALLAILGRAVFWPTSTRSGDDKVQLWGRIAAHVVTRPVFTLSIGLVIFGSLAIASFANYPSGFATATSPPKASDSYYGARILNSEFPSSSFNPTEVIFKFPTSVWSKLSTIEDLQMSLKKQSTFKEVFGPFNPLSTAVTTSQLSQLHVSLGNPAQLGPIEKPTLHLPTKIYQSYRAEYQFISPGGKTVLFATNLAAGDASSTAALNATPLIRSQVGALAAKYGATSYGVAGQAPAAYDIASSSRSDLVKIVPVVVIIIGVLLALVLRSLIAPIYLMISVVLSYLAALGADVIVFIFFRGDPGLNFVLPFLLFLFLLALGQDYNILVMTRIREEAHHRDLKSAVKIALNATGSTVTSAGMVLAGSFAVLALAQLGNAQVEEIGFGLALGILMDTFLVRTLLVPSAVVLLDKWNWWPSKLSHEFHTDAEAAAWETLQNSEEVN